MNDPKAFLFDLNGTMIDDMNYHIKAWHGILNEMGANIDMQRMKEECYGKNGELLERIFPGRFSEKEKGEIGFKKEKAYQVEFRPHLALLNGLENFIKHYHSLGVKMAIGSAAIMFNIDFVMDGLNVRRYFDALISADDVVNSKPHPETFLAGARALQVEPRDCLVFEDNPKGVEAAANAGMRAVVITTMHQPEEFKAFENIVCFKKDFTDLSIGNSSAKAV